LWKSFKASIDGPRLLVLAALAKSKNGRRALRECKATLDLPINNDSFSRRLVLMRYAEQLNITLLELEDLLMRGQGVVGAK
jgi:hypothetical protein